MTAGPRRPSSPRDLHHSATLAMSRVRKRHSGPGGLRLASGSCRFAVLMMEAVRSLGLAALRIRLSLCPRRPAGGWVGSARHAWLRVYAGSRLVEIHQRHCRHNLIGWPSCAIPRRRCRSPALDRFSFGFFRHDGGGRVTADLGGPPPSPLPANGDRQREDEGWPHGSGASAMPDDQQDVIAFLSDPSSYGKGGAGRIIETHISLVLSPGTAPTN
jgi:hypothetical protein